MTSAAHSRRLRVLPEPLAVCRLPPDALIPSWAWSGAFCSVTRTPNELSLVTLESAVPEGKAFCERGWRAFEVAGPLTFTLTGVLAALTTPLALANIPLFALSTYDTDYILVRAERLGEAVAALGNAGHIGKCRPYH